MEEDIEKLKYPIGKFDWSGDASIQDVEKAIQIIKDFPVRISDYINSLEEDQLDTPYRPGGWTVRQVVHHCADSHMNAYIRFKLALTEDGPTIKPYNQTSWANLPDSQLDPAVSLEIITGIHKRWVTIMENMTNEEWGKKYFHPEQNAWQVLKKIALMYGWHCEHHLAHITTLGERLGW